MSRRWWVVWVLVLMSTSLAPVDALVVPARGAETLDVNASVPIRALADSASPCLPVTIVSVRGSGEAPQPGGAKPKARTWLGKYGRNFVDRYRLTMAERIDNSSIAVRHPMGYFGIRYPAVPADDPRLTKLTRQGSDYRRKFVRSINAGVFKLMKFLVERHQNCPRERFVLVGWSQGAMAIHRASDNMLEKRTYRGIRNKIDAMVLVADGDALGKPGDATYRGSARRPRGVWWTATAVLKEMNRWVTHAPDRRGFPAVITNRIDVTSICDAHDIVCDMHLSAENFLGSGMATHSAYYLPSAPIKAAVTSAYLRMPEISGGSIPDAVAGTPYELRLGVVDGRKGTWSLGPQWDALPLGLSLSRNGVISGTPDPSWWNTQTSPDFKSWVRFTDRDGRSSYRELPFKVHQQGQTGTFTLVSANEEGVPGNGRSYHSAMSDDGSVITFQSTATDLTPASTNTRPLRLWDRTDDRYEIVDSRTSDAWQGYARCPSISSNGRFIAFAGARLWLYDRQLGEYSVPSDLLDGPVGAGVDVSADGRYVAFSTYDPLDPADSNNEMDVYRWDSHTEEIQLVSVTSAGEPFAGSSRQPSISADGSVVAWTAFADDAAAGDSNETHDVYVRDLDTGKTRIVSAQPDGHQSRVGASRPELSHDGQTIAFQGYGDLSGGDYPTAYVWHSSDATPTAVPRPPGSPYQLHTGDALALSPDSSKVVYSAWAYVSGTKTGSLYMWDRATRSLTRVLGPVTGPAVSIDTYCSGLAVDDAGSRVLFTAPDGDLVLGDTNGHDDVFLWEPLVADN